MNNYGGTPRDRFDPRRFEMQTREAMSQKIEDATAPYSAPCCRTEGMSRSRCGENTDRPRCNDDMSRPSRCGENMPRPRCGENMPHSCRREDSDCGHGEDGMNGFSLAMVYSPHQHWRNLYDEETGLKRGTIFEELDKPFHGPACMGGGCNG